MFKSKTFYIMSIILIILILSFAILIKTTLSLNYDMAKEANFIYSVGDNTLNPSVQSPEEYYAIQKEIKSSVTVDDFIMIQYASSIMLIVMAAFIAKFVCSEWDTGFVKNIIPLNGSRVSLVVSKNIIVLLFVLIEGIISIFVAMGSNVLVSGKVSILDFKGIIIYIGLQILLQMAFASLMILISYLFRSKSVTISIGILLGMNVHAMILNQLDKLINIANIEISNLSIINNIRILEFSSEPEIYKRVIIISTAYFLLYNILSLFRVKRVEVN